MRSLLRISALFTAAFAALACGGGGGANITIGTMPQGGTYQGVWQSPQYGNMHLCQTGTSVNGDYEKDERQGSIQGTIQGDVLRFHWEERRELVSGRPTITRGRGYFKLAIGEDGDSYIRGEWGIDDQEHGGGEWNGVKLRRRSPDRCLNGGSGGGDNGGDYDDYGDSNDYDDGGDDYDDGGGNDYGDDGSTVDTDELDGLDDF